MPCSSPPFGELVAVRADDATVAWRVPLGVFDDLKARGFGATGTPNIGGTIVTASGVIFVGATIDKRFRAFDADKGQVLWETTLPASAHATPMSSWTDWKQYVVFAAGGAGLFQSPGNAVVASAPSPMNISGRIRPCLDGAHLLPHDVSTGGPEIRRICFQEHSS